MFSKIPRIYLVPYRTCYALPAQVFPNLSWAKFKTFSHRKRMNLYLGSVKHIEEIRHIIPPEYMEVKRKGVAENLYLVDSKIAKHIAEIVLPFVKGNDQKMVCETNAGLGLLTSELLDGGVDRIRLYESCLDLRLTLKDFNDAYPGRVELFVKDFFHVWKMSNLDKFDKGTRVTQFLKGIPKREWSDEPVVTIIGTMSKIDFMSYLLRMISFQTEMATHGRIELFVIMRPGDYLKLTAGPHRDLHTYQAISILANTYCTIKLLEKYPRIAFLPWETIPVDIRRMRSYKKYDKGKLYLVHVEFKRDLPLSSEQLLPYYFFVKQTFGRGNIYLIQKLEQWIPGIGQEIILPEEINPLLEGIDIFTKTGQLTPAKFLEIFKTLHKHPKYPNSPLVATIEAALLKLETIDTDTADMNDRIQKNT